MPESEVDPVDIVGATKGHRKADPIWGQFNKRELPMDKAARLKRNYDAAYKVCGTEVPGKPLIMKRHLVYRDKATPNSQLLALKD